MIYSEAVEALGAFVDATGIPVAETMAGRGALVSDHPLSLGAVGGHRRDRGKPAGARRRPGYRVGTRWSDFTTASHSAFQDPGVRFVNVNVAAFDAGKQSGLPVVADARVALEQLRECWPGGGSTHGWEARAKEEAVAWGEEVPRRVALARWGSRLDLPTQAQIIKEINDAAGETGVVVCAAGSAPGDLHKLWRARDPQGKSYHVEYGYSCMGYEIPGGIGVKLAAPEREVYVLIGDGSYLMLPGELVTAVAQRVPIVVVLVDNHGYASIGALSRSVGSSGFGTLYRFSDNGSVPLDPASTDVLPARPGRQRREPRCVGDSGADDRGAARGAGRRAGRGRSSGDPHRGRPLPGRAELRELVGRAGGRGVRGGNRARGARGLRARPRPPAPVSTLRSMSELLISGAYDPF